MHELTSSIHAVTVFRQGALIERKVALPEGCQGAARVGGLPLTMLDHSISVRVEGPEPRPVVVDYRVGLQVNAAIEESDLDQRIEQARQQCERLKARKSTLQRLRLGLDAMEPQVRPQSAEGAPLGSYHLEGQMEMLAFREDQTAKLESELAQLERGLKKANEAFGTLRHEREQQGPKARPEALEKALVLTLRGTPGEGTTLYLQYRVPGARWAPAYSVGFSLALDKAELTMRAMVAQKTGEDWTSVELTLSTADPNEWREVPEWKALRIGRAEEPGGARWFAPPLGTDQLFSDYDASRPRGGSSATTASSPKMAPPPPPPIPESRPCESYPEERDEGGWVGGAGGGGVQVGAAQAVPLAAPCAPAPSGSFMRVDLLSRESRGGFGSVFGKSRRGASDDDDTVMAEEEMEPPVQTTLTLDQRYLRYQSLRLLDFNSPRRGCLVALEQWEEYQEVRSISWSQSEIVTAVEGAVFQASRVDHGGPPRGYCYPQSQSGFDFSYPAQAAVDLVSDGGFHSVPVFVCEMTPAIHYVCTPRESQQVFRTASMTNPSGRALPEGPADISVGGDFLHTTPLRGVTPEGVLRLGLGVEQSVKISRNATFKEGTSGLMGGTAELSHTIVVEAVNHRSQDIVLEVRERLPQPAPEHKDEMKVLLGQVKPAWESFEPEESPLLKSAYRWKLPLPAGQKVTATATYIVEMASKYELQGGNRREPRS